MWKVGFGRNDLLLVEQRLQRFQYRYPGLYFNTLIHCPNMVKKLSMYVGPHDVYSTMVVNFSILTRECKNKKLVDNIFSSNFVLLLMC